jgi:hypothetical protein
MLSKPKPKPDDPAQSKRFLDAAKEVEANDPEALDRAPRKIGKELEPKGERGRTS